MSYGLHPEYVKCRQKYGSLSNFRDYIECSLIADDDGSHPLSPVDRARIEHLILECELGVSPDKLATYDALFWSGGQAFVDFEYEMICSLITDDLECDSIADFMALVEREYAQQHGVLQ